MAAVKAAKKELRKQVNETLAKLSSEDIRIQSSKAVAKLLNTQRYQVARLISVYLSMPGGELQTRDIIHDALRHGKEVFIPFTHKSSVPPPASVMDMVKLHSLEDYEGLQPDKWGIPTPDKDSIATRELAIPPVVVELQTSDYEHKGLDLVIVPGMAFDKSMGRLGHGKGFYDYFFQRCRSHADARGLKMPHLVGLALTEQLLDDVVPTDESDWRLDALILGDGSMLGLST